MIHVVHIGNQHLYARQLDQMFRMRHAFYVEHYQWDTLRSVDGKEIDDFDHEETVYLLNLDRFGNILSTFRMNPSLAPNILCDAGLDYIADGIAPRSDEIWDLSRWMVAPDHRRQHANEIAPVQRPLLVGLMEFCQSRGITEVCMLTEAAFVQRLERIDWPLRRLGAPKPYTDGIGGEACAIMVETGPHVLAHMRNITGIYEPVLFELAPLPADTLAEQKRRIDAMAAPTAIEARLTQHIQEAANVMTSSLSDDDTTPGDARRIVDQFTQTIRQIAANIGDPNASNETSGRIRSGAA